MRDKSGGEDKTQQKDILTNYLRRTVGVAICSAPIVLLMASIVAALNRDSQSRFSSIGWMIAALLIGILNSYLSFLRPWLIIRQRGSLEGVRNVSGIPIIGTFLIVAGALFGFGSIGTAALGLIAVLLDTGGAPWFLVATWRDSGIWDNSQ